MSSYFLRSRSRDKSNSNQDLAEDTEILVATEEFKSPSRDPENKIMLLPTELQQLIDTAVEKRMSELDKQKANVPVLPPIDTNTIMREMFAMNKEFLKTMSENFVQLSENMKAPRENSKLHQSSRFPKIR